MKLRQMADLQPGRSPGEAESLAKLADETEHSIKPLKELVGDVRLFGRQG